MSEPVVGEARTAAAARDEAYFREQCRRSGIYIGAPPVADVPSGDTGLPEEWVRLADAQAEYQFLKAKYEATLSEVELLRSYKFNADHALNLAILDSRDSLPWLPQPDSEGWWWHKFGPPVATTAREVKSMLGPDDEQWALYVPSLGNYVDYCGGEWQKVIQPSEIKKEEV